MFSPRHFIDMSATDFSDIFDGVDAVWEILPRIGPFITGIDKERLLDSGYTMLRDDLFVGKETVIVDSAFIQGPAVIGSGCEIRHNAFIRGRVIIGDGVTVGNSCEIKNSFICSDAQIPHFNYVGDAVLGRHAHLGAGVICSNVRSIPGNVTVRSGDDRIDTGLRKFSAVFGDDAEVGCNAVLNPGSIIGRRSVIYPLTSFRGTLAADMVHKQNGSVVPLRAD